MLFNAFDCLQHVEWNCKNVSQFYIYIPVSISVIRLRGTGLHQQSRLRQEQAKSPPSEDIHVAFKWVVTAPTVRHLNEVGHERQIGHPICFFTFGSIWIIWIIWIIFGSVLDHFGSFLDQFWIIWSLFNKALVFFFQKVSLREMERVHLFDRCTNPLTPGLNDLPRLAGLVWDQGEERDQDMASRKRQTVFVVYQIYVAGYVTLCL